MRGLLAGTSRQSIAFVLANLRPLCILSVLPGVLVTLLGVVYLTLYGVDLQAGDELPEPTTMGEAFERLAPDLGFRLASMLLWLWLAVKVLRYHMLQEAPSVIGAGGTLRATGRMFLYHLGFVPMLAGLAMMVLMVAVIVHGILQSELAYLLAGTIGGLAIAWAGCRIFVGFVPVAVGERPPFFSGWALTEKDHVGLVARFIGASAAITAALVAMSLGWFFVFGDPLGAVIVDGADADAGTASGGLVGHVLVFYVIMQAVSVMVNWYFMVFFSNAYLRLNRRQAPGWGQAGYS